MYFYRACWEDVESRECATFLSDKKLTEKEFNDLVDHAVVNALEYALNHSLDCQFRVRWDAEVGMKMGDLYDKVITEIESLGLKLVCPEKSWCCDYDEAVSIKTSDSGLQARLEAAKQKAREIGNISLDVRLGRKPEH